MPKTGSVACHGGKVGPCSGMAHGQRRRLGSKRCMSSAISTEPVLGAWNLRVVLVVKVEKMIMIAIVAVVFGGGDDNDDDGGGDGDEQGY